MILHVYTIIHTLISLVGIFTGTVVLFGLLQTSRWLDQMVPDHYRAGERYRLLLSVRWFHACSWSRDHIVVGIGSCNLRALPASARGRLALDLRRHGCDCALSQRVCRGRPGFPESAGFTCDGTHADRAAI